MSTTPAYAEDPATAAYARQEPSLLALYRALHAAPELSLGEVKTAATMAAELAALSFEVTTGVGGHGVVGVLRNGPGPVVLLRTDMDALPIAEKTGLPFASQVQATDHSGRAVSVMHACGHDMHMTSWAGAARVLAQIKDRWSGTLVLIAQPAEELGQGASRMLADGLFRRFPRPDFAVALHVSAELPAGDIGYSSEHAFAGVDGVDITVFGKGGHGAYPHKTVDPVVIAARIVSSLQTVVARENNPLDPAVVTVGSIHGGTKRNVIPDEVKLELTVRSYKPEVRQRLLAAIERVAEGEALAAGAPKKPRVEVRADDHTEPVVNDSVLAERAAAAMRRALGPAHVRKIPPVMGGEDFGAFGRAGVPAFIFWLGAVEPDQARKAEKGAVSLPSLHSPLFAPAATPTLRTGVVSLTAIALDLFALPSRSPVPTP